MLNYARAIIVGAVIGVLILTSDASAQPVTDTRGMVSSSSELATQAGVDVLRDGGNAFDAAVAVAAMLNVVEPMMSGLGGYGTVLVHDAAHGETWFLNASAHIPRGVDSNAFRAPTPRYEENRVGAKAVSTPGAGPAWEAMWERFGSKRWQDLLEPAARTADEGIAIDERLARFIGAAFDSFPDHTKEFYGLDGVALSAGDMLVQKDLARTLRLLGAEGSSVLRTGTVAQRIARTIGEAEGFLAIEDLRDAKAEWWEPISIDYRGYEVMTASPPATAYPSLVRLGLMARFDVQEMGHNSAEYLHTFAEVTKIAFWSRLRYAGDPDHTPPPLDMLYSPSWLSEKAGAIDPNRAADFVPPGPVGEPSEHTTHFVVADAQGNVVSATLTLGQGFGSRIMPQGTGLWLNNSLRYCTFEPAGNPMDAHAGRRKLSGDCPTIVMRDGRPWLVIGTPGGHTIGQTVPQMVMNVIDFGMNVQDAIAAPRISFIDPDRLLVENTIASDVRQALVDLGHNVQKASGLGNAHGLTIEYDSSGKPVRFEGGADPRGTGVARGLN